MEQINSLFEVVVYVKEEINGRHGRIPIDLKLMVKVKVVMGIVVPAEAPLGATDGVLVGGEMEDVGCVNDGLMGSGMYMVGP